jgi:superfamily II DNA/RNA helicase
MNPFRNIEEQIDANLKLRGYTELTSIQKAIIKKEITGRDAIV